ncbi:conserved hypothetical protein [[Clostridium] ultunense Esp]|nr:conserved hypothetical protein [[Clostridium] ultunense Esp]
MRMEKSLNENKIYDVLILGGSLGGTIAAYAAAKMGKKVALIEETKWIGGQMTNQAVPPDEHQWIESYGATRSYREFRQRVRDYYRRNYPLNEEAIQNPFLNPGNAWVSRLSHEPRVSLMVIYELIAPYISNGRLTVYLEHRFESVKVSGDWIEKILVRDLHTQNLITFKASFFLDATELGLLIHEAGVEYKTGSESRKETGEEHAPYIGNPSDIQPMTWVAAVEYVQGGGEIIAKPSMYDMWKEYTPSFLHRPIFSWNVAAKNREDVKRFYLFSNSSKGRIGLFQYRRVIDHTLFQEGFYRGDLSLINWPQNDYLLGSLIGVEEHEYRFHLKASRELTLSLIYWLQTEAERDDGGFGYPEIQLRGDIVGTEDGLALYPYIRESRRIDAMVTIRENNVVEKTVYKDSIGIGHYAIDLHPTLGTYTHLYLPTVPFEIPLGSMIPKRVRNLIPANSKLIGTTHITNGCFRVHPIEWNVGEAAGYLIAYSSSRGITPFEVWANERRLCEFQDLLIQEGITLHWSDDFI